MAKIVMETGVNECMASTVRSSIFLLTSKQGYIDHLEGDWNKQEANGRWKLKEIHLNTTQTKVHDVEFTGKIF